MLARRPEEGKESIPAEWATAGTGWIGAIGTTAAVGFASTDFVFVSDTAAAATAATASLLFTGASLPAGVGFVAVRSANSTIDVLPGRTATFLLTVTTSPFRSYSALNL